jgi:hypothetical protein
MMGARNAAVILKEKTKKTTMDQTANMPMHAWPMGFVEGIGYVTTATLANKRDLTSHLKVACN